MSKILIGCDPEVFVKSGGQFVSAHGLIAGNKEDPQKVERGAVQVDGMALEFNIDPAHSEQEFVLNVTHVFDILQRMVPNHELAVVPVADFGADYIAAQPEEARMLGCDPDYNAWSGQVNEKPQAELPFRTASGHVHIGWAEGLENHHDQCRASAIQMDFYLGLPSLFYDNDTRRREMYGNPGCYRPKPYGVEYRTLSNAWLLNKDRMAWVYRNAVKGMQDLMAGKYLFEKYGDIQDIIKKSDKKAAMKIIKAEKLEMV